jgi:hypothetical protein
VTSKGEDGSIRKDRRRRHATFASYNVFIYMNFCTCYYRRVLGKARKGVAAAVAIRVAQRAPTKKPFWAFWR